MTIFAVLFPREQPGIVERVKEAFPNDHLEVTPTQWLVSASGTVLDVTSKLGIYDPSKPDSPASGSAIVFATSSYHGRAPTLVWEWVKNKLEGKPNG